MRVFSLVVGIPYGGVLIGVIMRFPGVRSIVLITVILLISIPIFAQSGSVGFAWDAHPQASELAGFHLYQTKQSGNYTGVPAATFAGGATVAGSISRPGLGRFFWVLTAFAADGTESDYSNEVTAIIKPDSPKNFIKSALSAALKPARSLLALLRPHKVLRISNS